MNAPVGVILAGGLSRRMGGGDKSLRLIDGTSMLDRIIERLRPQVDSILLNANGNPERFAETGLPVVADPIAGHAGPLAGVLAGMEWVSSNRPDSRHIVTIASDTPFFPENLVEKLLTENENEDSRIVLASSCGNRHPVFGLWPVALSGQLRDFLSETDTFKVMAFVKQHDFREASFPLVTTAGQTYDPFFNANTPDDILMAARLARETVS